MIEAPQHWKKVTSSTVVDSPYLQVQKRTYQLPSGEVIDDYYHVTRSDYVLIIAYTEKKEILIERQYRRGYDQVILELPSGWVDADESADTAALRELQEESGISAEHVTIIGKLAVQPAWSDMTAHVCLVQLNSSEISHLQGSNWHAHRDDTEIDEEIQLKLIPLKEIKEMIQAGKFHNMGDLAALMLFLQSQSNHH